MRTAREFSTYVLDQLAPVGVIQTSHMFGGVLLKVNNKPLGVILSDTLYFKVRELELEEKFLAMDSQQLKYVRKDKDGPLVIQNWWSIPEEILENKKELVGLAYEVLLQGT